MKSILVGLLFIACTGLAIDNFQLRDGLRGTEPPVSEYGFYSLPSLGDVQQYLKDEGYYNGRVDDIYGERTKEAWEACYIAESAARYFPKEIK